MKEWIAGIVALAIFVVLVIGALLEDDGTGEEK